MTTREFIKLVEKAALENTLPMDATVGHGALLFIKRELKTIGCDIKVVGDGCCEKKKVIIDKV